MYCLIRPRQGLVRTEVRLRRQSANLGGCNDKLCALIDVDKAEALEILGPTVQILAEDAEGGPCVLRGIVP